jgi:tetratricopeptide (TPR) repeat protein
MNEHFKDYPAAIKDYTQVIELNPKNAEAFNSRGNSKYLSADYYGAMQDNSKAIELNPKFSKAYFIRGICKYAMKDKQGACIDLNKAMDLGCMEAYEKVNEFCK